MKKLHPWEGETGEREHAINGVPGRVFWGKHHNATLYTTQRWVSTSRRAKGDYKGCNIVAEIRFDDSCGNGHMSFGITATIRDSKVGRDGGFVAGGCLHEEIAAAFPELAPLIKWHLCDTSGPMHYIANTLYHAGDRDCHGLRKGEQKPIMAADGIAHWHLEAMNAPGTLISTTPTGERYKDSGTVPLFILKDHHKGQEPPAVVPTLRWVQDMRTGEGKARELDHARSTAVWPEATDAELCAEPAELRAKLAARLPGLIAAMRADITAAGFDWVEPEAAK